MPADTITTIGGSVVQHGPCNDRIYVMSLSAGDLPGIVDRLDALAKEAGYSKIFAKVPASALDLFLTAGYVTEACVPRFFRGREDGYFMAKYFDPGRSRDEGGIDDVLSAAQARAGDRRPCSLPPGYACVPATPADAPEIAALYGEVFDTYPFPIHDPGYIVRTMGGQIRYFCIRTGDGRIAAVSSSEMDAAARNVEMTDFATLPGYRGMGLAGCLLARMEEEMREEGCVTAYTIARSSSFPINVTFARAGYTYGGTLKNNTNICGTFESMNVWYKRLDE